MLIESFGFLDHRGGDIDADTRGEALGEGLGEAADTASEVERLTAEIGRAAQLFKMTHHGPDFDLTGGHEFIEVPTAAFPGGIGEDRVQRILFCERFPIAFQRGQCSHSNQTPL